MWWLKWLVLVTGRQINPVSVLLPYTVGEYNRVNVTLQAYGGCYRWRVQRPNVVKIRNAIGFELEEGIDKLATDIYMDSGEEVGNASECHNMVVVSQWYDKSLKKKAIETREKSWVFAEDILKDGDGGVKCEVYVARIERIVIETTAKSLAVGGVETLTIRAFDNEGNVFTSLEGLRFQWEIENPNIIAIASLKNDVYRPTPIRRTIHERGEESDIILLKGLVSGRTLVKTRLIEDGYQDIEATQVWLDVIEPIVVVPNHLILPPLAQVNLGVKVLKDKETPSQAKLVAQPHQNFTWTSSSPDRASVHMHNGHVIIKPGAPVPSTIMVQVSDKRNLNNTDSTTIYIRHPHSLRLMHAQIRIDDNHLRNKVLAPLEDIYQKQFHPELGSGAGGAKLLKSNSLTWKRPTWYITKNQPLLVGTDLLTADLESIYIPRNADFKINATEGIEILWTSKAQSLAVIVPRTAVSGTISAQFKSIAASENHTYTPNQDIVVHQKFVVVEQIRLEHFPQIKSPDDQFVVGINTQTFIASENPIVLPIVHEAEFSVTGGSGNYKVESSNPDICKVLSNSIQSNISIKTSKQDGLAIITIMDEMNSENLYRIPCVAARIRNIVYDPQFKQIPLTNRETSIPIRATPIISANISQSPHWKTGIAEFFSQCHINILHTATRGAALSLNVIPPANIYECSRLKVITNYQEPQILELAAANMDSEIITTTIQLEYFAPLKIQLPKPKVSHKAITANHTVTSARIASSVAIAIDSSLNIQILGGPSVRSGCTRTLDVNKKDQSKVKISKVGGDFEGSGEFKQNFKLSCLDKITLYEINFNIRTKCTDNSHPSLNAQLMVGCSIPQKVRVIPVESRNPEFMPAENRTWQIVDGKHPNHRKPPVIPAENKIFFTIGDRHTFQPVAWDNFGRELLNISSFNPRWWLSSDETVTLKPDGDCIALSTDLDSFKGKLSVALIRSKADVGEGWIKSDVGNDRYIAASLEIAAARHPVFGNIISDEPLIYLPNWAYRVLVLNGSGRYNYTLSPPTAAHILAVDHGSGTPPQTSVFKPDWTIIDLNLDTIGLGHSYSSFDDALVQSLELGNATLIVEDKSLLGAKPITLKMSFNAVTHLELALYDEIIDSRGQATKILKAHSTKSPTLREIQTDLDYKIEFTAKSNYREFHPVLTNALATGVTVNPPAKLTNTTSFSVSNTGRYFISGYLLGHNKTKIVQTNSIELLAHFPLKVEPSELILLPDGSTCEIKIQGGSSGIGSYGISSGDRSVVQVIDSEDDPKIPFHKIVTGHKGKTLLNVIRNGGQSTEDRAPIITVEVAQPTRTGLVLNGKLFVNNAATQLIGIPNRRTGRIIGQLLTAQNKPFTIGLLGLTDDSELYQPRYKCDFALTSDSPKVVAFVNDDLQGQSLVSKLEGRGKIAASFVSLKPGNARITFSSQCGPTSGWTKFSRFADSTTVVVMVTEDSSAIKEIETVTAKGILTDLQLPLEANNPHAQTFGEPLRVLGNSKYTFTLPWDIGSYEFFCKDVTANPMDCITSSNITPINHANVKNDRELNIATGHVVGQYFTIAIRGTTSKQVRKNSFVTSS